MKRRIFGLENEYGLTCTLNGQRRLSPDNVARYLFEKVIPGARNANVFLENGARLYLDTGFHPEYAPPFQRLAESLTPFFVPRQIFAGAGKVLQTPRGFHYCLSQRAQHICQEISGATTSSRSIINTRDEPHADAEKFRRLHVIVGDSNMSEVATM